MPSVVILAAGRGSRLHPFTSDCPKCLTEIHGCTLLEHQVRTLKAVGLEDITIVSGYRGEMLERPDVTRLVNPNWSKTNMVESLFAARERFGDDLIVSYSDIVYETSVILALLKSEHDISVIVDRAWRNYWQERFDDPLRDAESLTLDYAERITDIGNKVSEINDIEAQYIGLMRFQGAGIETLVETKKRLGDLPRTWMDRRTLSNAYMTDLLMEIILRGHDVYGVEIDGGWLEIDTPHDLKVANGMIASSPGAGLRIRRLG